MNRHKVQLTKKFAEFLDGIDLSRVKAGEFIELSERDAHILVEEGWARRVARREVAVAADSSRRRERRKTARRQS